LKVEKFGLKAFVRPRRERWGAGNGPEKKVRGGISNNIKRGKKIRKWIAGALRLCGSILVDER